MIEERIQQQSQRSIWSLGKIVEVGAARGLVLLVVGAARAAPLVRGAVTGKELTNAARLPAAAVAVLVVLRGSPRGTSRPPCGLPTVVELIRFVAFGFS